VSETESLAFEFACYIADRVPRDTPWTSVYDEMCRVVRSRAFRGMGYAELADVGISLSITGLDRTCRLLEEAWEAMSRAGSASPYAA